MVTYLNANLQCTELRWLSCV